MVGPGIPGAILRQSEEWINLLFPSLAISAVAAKRGSLVRVTRPDRPGLSSAGTGSVFRGRRSRTNCRQKTYLLLLTTVLAYVNLPHLKLYLLPELRPGFGRLLVARVIL